MLKGSGVSILNHLASKWHFIESCYQNIAILTRPTMQSSCHDSVVISFNVDWKEFKSTSNYFSPPVFIKKKKRKRKIVNLVSC